MQNEESNLLKLKYTLMLETWLEGSHFRKRCLKADINFKNHDNMKQKLSVS